MKPEIKAVFEATRHELALLHEPSEAAEESIPIDTSEVVKLIFAAIQPS